MSTVAVEADYRAQGKGQLFEKALPAMHDPAYQEISAEYEKNGGLWKTASVVMVTQLLDSLDEAADTQNKKAIADTAGSMSWLTSAATQARKNYAQNFSYVASQPKKSCQRLWRKRQKGVPRYRRSPTLQRNSSKMNWPRKKPRLRQNTSS